MTPTTTLIENPRKDLNRAQIRDKCIAFRDRELSSAEVAARMLELYGVKISGHTVKSYCLGRRG